MEGVSLQQHYEDIRIMVKQKTGRAMQEKVVKYTDKKGKQRVRQGCSPIREGVVNIKPDQIEIISYGGAERSIKLDDLRAGKRIHARRYSNPRLGEFLKELHLTECRGTGFPTIHAELKKNGSPDSIIEADDEHTYFIIRIPCHPEFVCEELSMDKDGHILPVGEVWTPDVTDGTVNGTVNGTGVTDNVTEGFTAEIRRREMMHLMQITPKITMDNLVNILHILRRTIARDINFLKANGKLKKDGDDKSGVWVVLE